MDDLLRGPMPYLKNHVEWKGDLSRERIVFSFECRHEIDCDWYEPHWERGVCAHRCNGIKCANQEAQKGMLNRIARKAKALAKEIEARA